MYLLLVGGVHVAFGNPRFQRTRFPTTPSLLGNDCAGMGAGKHGFPASGLLRHIGSELTAIRGLIRGMSTVQGV